MCMQCNAGGDQQVRARPTQNCAVSRYLHELGQGPLCHSVPSAVSC